MSGATEGWRLKASSSPYGVWPAFWKSDEAADTERDAFLVGVDEAHASHPLRDGAGGLDDGSLVALQVKACLDRLPRQEVHFLDRERHVAGLGDVAQARTRSDQTVDALGEHHDVGHHLAPAAVGAHANHLARQIANELRDRGLTDDGGAGLPHLGGEPLVERRADDGVAVGLLLVEVVGLVVQPTCERSSIIQKRCSTRWRSSGASSRKFGMIFSSMSE